MYIISQALHTRTKCAKKPISFFVFKILLKQNIAMERFILQKNKTTHIYEDRWTHIENMI
jgi:hypothetical protein